MEPIEPIAPQATGVPVDFRDTNHPHYPSDLESQPPTQTHYKYTPFMSKKAVWILSGILLVFASLAVAIVTGIKVGANQVQSLRSMTITDVETVFSTSEVKSTTLFPLARLPDAATTTTIMTLPLPSELPPASSKVIPATSVPTVTSFINWFPVAPAFSWTPPTTTEPAGVANGEEAWRHMHVSRQLVN
ncbi:hypothetical protein FB567DRAFT_611056 [Paraphoma chrysanthemicola]|uniref:Uncharacterized protein n=1 Tax=Paraphoma chrysanthemicola TaxID=798071 RepID=A0A8K0QW45_9PLEO|nr:hypothetical protein FB567DRAFT_611056 [Paraphoma chrysanthemicola]